MFSHVVIFYTKPEVPNAVADLVAGCETYLRDIPGVRACHIGRMAPSPRPVVVQDYQVGLNLVFDDQAAEAAYQVHPRHLEFVAKVFKPLCTRAVIYDFA